MGDNSAVKEVEDNIAYVDLFGFDWLDKNRLAVFYGGVHTLAAGPEPHTATLLQKRQAYFEKGAVVFSHISFKKKDFTPQRHRG